MDGWEIKAVANGWHVMPARYEYTNGTYTKSEDVRVFTEFEKLAQFLKENCQPTEQKTK